MQALQGPFDGCTSGAGPHICLLGSHHPVGCVILGAALSWLLLRESFQGFACN